MGSSGYDSGAAALAQDLNEDYAGLPFDGDGLMLANTPWSGSYQVGLSIWVMAHTAQFTGPGWRYLDSGSVNLSGGLSAGPVQVWATDLNSSSSADWFRHVAEVRPHDGTFRLTLQPGYLYTVTTTTGQRKGSAVSATLELPSGWTSSPVPSPPGTLTAGQRAPAGWRVTAPRSRGWHPGAGRKTKRSSRSRSRPCRHATWNWSEYRAATTTSPPRRST